MNYLTKQVIYFYIVKMPNINRSASQTIFDSSFTIQLFTLDMKIPGTTISLY